MQNERFYHNTLNKISTNQENISHRIVSSNAPFKSLRNDNMMHWDVFFYGLIKNEGYNVKKANGEHVFAFFPLFPYVWKITFLPTVAIPFLNYLFFLIGIFLLSKIITNDAMQIISWCSVLLPGLVVFLIPYSEALYFLCITIALVGFIKSKYLLYFVGMVLASMTRSATMIVLISFLLTEIIQCSSDKKILYHLKSLGKNTLPIIIGTLMVAIIQLNYHHDGLFKFAEAQKYWNRIFSLPGFVNDWSKEGFGINLASYFLIGFPSVAYVIIQIRKKNNASDPFSYLRLLSTILMSGVFLFIYFYQQGSLHSLFRYILCSPFLFLLLFLIDIKKIDVSIRLFIFLISFFAAFFMLSMTNYSAAWEFNDLGFFVLFAALAAWLFHDFAKSKIFKIALSLILLINVVWTAYLFNIYLSDGWLFI